MFIKNFQTVPSLIPHEFWDSNAAYIIYYEFIEKDF